LSQSGRTSRIKWDKATYTASMVERAIWFTVSIPIGQEHSQNIMIYPVVDLRSSDQNIYSKSETTEKINY